MLRFLHSDSRVQFRMRHFAVAALASVSLAACGGETATTGGAGGAASNQYEVAGDHAIGNPDAEIVVIEYASVVCGACANWHNTVYADFKDKYIDTGKVRFIFREFPTPPENLARAGFLIANCAAEDKFMENISLQFKRQRAMLTSANVRQEYVNLAKASGLSEEEFQTCLANTEENDRLDQVEEDAYDAGVTSTPTFFINGEKVERVDGGKQLFTLESFDLALAQYLTADVEIEPEMDDTASRQNDVPEETAPEE